MRSNLIQTRLLASLRFATALFVKRLWLIWLMVCAFGPGRVFADDEPRSEPAGRAGKADVGTVLGIEGTRFTINGKPTFLLGVSYYAGLGASEDFIRRDLDDIKRLGFNWLRVWATCEFFDQRISAVNSMGRPREPYLSKLKRLLAECDRRGLAVDVTLTRDKEKAEAKDGTGLSNFKAHRQAVETLVVALKGYRNWYLDLANEHDVGDAPRAVGGDQEAAGVGPPA